MKKLLQLALCCVMLLASCDRFKRSGSKWSNNFPIADISYTEDSIRIIRQLKVDLKAHKGFFSSREYSDSTQIIVDTVIYNSTYSKLAVFIIAKNPTSRQLLPDTRSDWYYNATCYLGIRESKDSLVLYSTGPVLTNSIDKQELKSLMRAQYFTFFARLKNAEGELKYKYNLGDVRFWESPIWDELEIRRIRREEFEKEKKENPNNIYEPKYHD